MTDIGTIDLDAMVATLTLDEKVRLLTGRDGWSTHAIERIGLRPIVFSDGPSGVRGTAWDERFTSLNLPSGTALASSWDTDLAARYGAVAAAEARAKGVDVVLGPTVNLHRSPLGGRHFEAFSEDPVLTADLAAAYVRGVQDNGVAATPKHYVANDSETERYRVDVRVGERPLRELYLRAFEKAVTEAGAWVVMSAYNSVNGVRATESPLLTDPLTTTWGFDGVVVSDWTAVRTIESARQPQDLSMPGPRGPWGSALVDAVQRGDVAEATIDRKVRRLLRLAARIGALRGHEPAPVHAEDGVAFARHAAIEGMVLVRNEGILPLRPHSLSKVLVLGQNARKPRTQGGGSATVLTGPVLSPVAALREALPGRVTVVNQLGATVEEGFAALDPARMTNPATGAAGARVRYLSADGRELWVEDRNASFIHTFGDAPWTLELTTIEFTTRYLIDTTGTMGFGFAHPGHGRMTVDGRLVLEETLPPVGADQIDAFFAPEYRTARIAVTEGQVLNLAYTFEPGEIVDGIAGAYAVQFGQEPVVQNAEMLIHAAAEAAAGVDAVVVVVGTKSSVESEGVDRSDLRLPGRQDDLVAAVAAVNPQTVVVVNAGAPVEMPWRDDVAAILLTWFGGQEFGPALVDVLTGAAEPGGRLPTTWPGRLADVPVSVVTPVEGVLRYDEGLHIGYKAWLRAGTEPAYPFGTGLGYTTWRIEAPRVIQNGAPGAIGVVVANTGARAGKQIVQVYATRAESAVERPALWLVGFAVVRLEPGRSQAARVDLDAHAFAHWDSGWQIEPGDYVLRAGDSSASLGAPITVTMSAAGRIMSWKPGPA